MSRTIDQNVVEMRFDNRDFERNVADTMVTLDKFKNKLNLSGSAKGFEEIGRSAGRLDFAGLNNAIDTVNSRFSALGIMGVTALQNITNSAINTGKRMLSALTIDPITTGFEEYNTKINAIQTIKSNTASKGTTMDEITQTLDELNRYADKTIYNFAEMTRNIGYFTTAGLGLEESSTSIEGLSNLAATAGANSEQAARAMYQLSQGLTSGVIRLMDWRSLENASMGSVMFQDAIKATARENGIAIDEIIKKHGSFRDSLSENWLTAELMTTTLKKFTVEGAKEYGKAMQDAGKWTQAETDALVKQAQSMEDAATKVKTFKQLWSTLTESAQSGWAQTWEYIVGNFDEAQDSLTKIKDEIEEVLVASAEARNNLLKGWKEAGGRTDLVDSLLNIIQAIKSVAAPIKDAFTEIFPPLTVQHLVDATAKLKEFTEGLKLGETASNNLKRTFKGVFAIFDILGQALSAVYKVIKPLFGGLDDLGGGFLEGTASLGDWLVKLSDTIRTTDIFNKSMEKVANFVKMAYEGVKKFTGIIKEKIVSPGMELLQSLLERINIRLSGVGEAAGEMKDGISGAFKAIGTALSGSSFVKLLGSIWNFVQKIGSGIATVLGKLASGLADSLDNANYQGFFDFINTLSFSTIAAFIVKFVKGFSDMTGSVGSFKDSALGILDEVRGCFETWQSSLKSNVLLKIASAIAILVAALVVLSFVDSKKLSAGIGAITMLFTDLVAAMAIMSKLDGGFDTVSKITTSMLEISIAVLILAAAMKKIADLSVGGLLKGIAGVFAMTMTLVLAMKMIQSDGKKVVKGAVQMLIFAAGIRVLADACATIGKLKLEEVGKGLLGLIGIMAIMIILAKVMDKSSIGLLTASASMILFGVAMNLLIKPMKEIATLKWEGIAKGLVGIAGAMLAVALAMKLMPMGASVLSAASMVIVAGAMIIFVQVMKMTGELNWEQIGKGLAVIGGTMLVLAAGLTAMVAAKAGSLALVIAAAALALFVPILHYLGNMEWEQIGKGLVAIGGAIAILAIGLNAMITTIPGAAALLIATAALGIMTPILYALGSMSWDTITQGLTAIALAFAVIGVAGLVLTPLVPSIIGLAAALALIGASVVLAAVGLAIGAVALSGLAVGITALATALSAGATAIVAGMTVIVVGAVNLIPIIIQKLGEGFIALCEVIANGAPAIGKALGALVTMLIKVLIDNVPAIADGIVKLLVELMNVIVKYTPDIVDALFDFVIALLNGVAERLPELIQAAVNVIMAFFEGVVAALEGIDTETLLKGLAGIGIMSLIMMALAAVAALVPAAMLGVVGMGLVIAELALMLAAVGALAQIPGLEWLIGEGGDLLQKVGNALGKFIGGIVGGIAEGATAALPQIGKDLSEFVTNAQPFLDQAETLSTVLPAIKALSEAILILTAADILDGLTAWFTGDSSLTEFGKELAAFGPYMKQYADSVAGIDPAAVESSASAAKILAEMASEMPNYGGLVSLITGENSLTVFGAELAAFGPYMQEYANSVSGLNTEAVQTSANAALTLAKMASEMPAYGGLVALVSGENSLTVFGAELAAFGPLMAQYAKSVDGVNVTAVKASATAAKTLAEMASIIPSYGGLDKLVSGQNSLAVFGAELVAFGPLMFAYAKSVENINTSAITSTTSAVRGLISLIKDIGSVSIKNVESFGDALKNLAEAGIDEFVNAFKESDIRAKNAISTMLNTCVVAIVQKRQNFEIAGKQLVAGFAAGISANTYMATAKARAMAQAAVDAANEELDIHSPSRVLYESGMNAGKGFVNALVDSTADSYSAGSDVASAAREGINDVIKKVNDVINSDINPNPSIRPVVDLSQVKTAANSISSLFNDPSVGIAANVGNINAMLSQRGQNGSNKDIISAISDLRKDIANMPRNTYSVGSVTYDDGSNIASAIEALIHGALIERRV